MPVADRHAAEALHPLPTKNILPATRSAITSSYASAGRKASGHNAASYAYQLLTGTDVERCAALQSLHLLVTEMVDIRLAQPAITSAIVSHDVHARRLAVGLTQFRASEGHDVRLAFPALIRASHDGDEEVRIRALHAIAAADARHHELR
jgi:hypothetical protein